VKKCRWFAAGCSQESARDCCSAAPGRLLQEEGQASAASETPKLIGMGAVTDSINSSMVIRQGNAITHARVHPVGCSGTLRDRAGVSLHTNRDLVSPRGI